MFDPNERDSYNDPYIFLRDRLLEKNYLLTTADDNSLHDCEWVFFFDIASVFPYSNFKARLKRTINKARGISIVRDLYSECLNSHLKDKMVLFLWEAPAVSPDNWKRENHEAFNIIFTWNDSIVDSIKYFKICWPQTGKFSIIPKIPFGKKKLLVNISMNKYSNHKRELYSERIKSIRHFETALPENFDLYGYGWNNPANLVEKILPFKKQVYSSYRGTVKNKWDVLPFYRFSLCYENLEGEPGYITEKIFDSMRCGCVPIYLGAPNITDYVDSNAFVDRRIFKTNKDLEDFIINIDEQEYKKYQDAIKDYLAGERFKNFLPESFANTINNTLKL